jgi:hypothetical protein
MTHTPGPWLLEAANAIVDADGNGVAYTSAQQPRPQEKANARLIAASPKMLAALHAAVNWYTPPNDSKTAFPLKQIADAIAEAESRTVAQ